MIAFIVVFAFAAALPLQVASYSDSYYSDHVRWYEQCGGKGYSGQTTCYLGSECKKINEFFSKCVPIPTGDSEKPGPYEQCGGRGYDGFLCGDRQCCSAGLECVFINEHFSQCIPEFTLADFGEPCGPATPDNKRCLLQSRAAINVFMKCSSDTDPDAKCVPCGYRSLSCCPAGIVQQDRPPCHGSPRYPVEIPCNTEKDICEDAIMN